MFGLNALATFATSLVKTSSANTLVRSINCVTSLVQCGKLLDHSELIFVSTMLSKKLAGQISSFV
jgi:hypothetical protein